MPTRAADAPEIRTVGSPTIGAMALPIAQRAIRIPPFEVMEIVRAAAQRESAAGPADAASVGRGRTVCHLEVGQPSTGAPTAVRDAAHAALDRTLGYTDSQGIPELRQAIADWYGATHAIEIDRERIVVTTGASAGCVLTFVTCFDPGDRVGVVEPGYPCYRHMLDALGIDVVGIHVGPSSRYQPTPEMLDRITADVGPLAGLVVASPSNPTGAMLTPSELGAITQWCDSRGTRLIADEIYHHITDGRAAPTAAKVPDAVVIQSFSKYFCMTGWRLGWLVLPLDLVDPLDRVAQNLYLSPPTLSQLAALGAFGATAELEPNVTRYDQNRRELVEMLRRVGTIETAPAEGAFYVWADVRHYGTSRELCRRWLDEIGVAATPGWDFDPVDGGHFVRFSIAGSVDEVAEAARRLEHWFTDAHQPQPERAPRAR